MLSTAQQMLQDSRTKIELLRMQIVKVTQAREGEREASETEGECNNRRLSFTSTFQFSQQ